MDINNLSKYVSFLYKNLINDVSEFYFNKSKSTKFSFLKYRIQSSNSKELVQETEAFLRQVVKQKKVEKRNEWIDNITGFDTALIPEKETPISDYILILKNRKYTLLHFISRFTQDINVFEELINQIEDCFSIQEHALIVSFQKSQQIKNDELTLQLNSSEDQLKEYANIIKREESIAHLGHYELDFKSGKIQCSEEFYNFFGLELNSNIDISQLEKMTLKDNGYNPFSKSTIQSFIKDIPAIHEFKIRRKDQTLRTLVSCEYPVLSENGEVISVKGFIQDVTDKNGIEKISKESQNLINQIIENAPTLIFILDLTEGKYNYINDSAQKLLGYSIDFFQNLTIQSFIQTIIYPDDLKMIEERLQAYSHSVEEDFRTIEYRMVDSNGNIHWVYSKAVVLEKENNRIKQILVNAVEITELKKTEQELANTNKEVEIAYKKVKESQERFQSFVNQISIGICRLEFKDVNFIDTTLPLDQQIELMIHSYIAEGNDHLAKMFGLKSAKELIGHSLTDFFATPIDEYREFCRDFIQSGYKFAEIESGETKIQNRVIYLNSNLVGILEDSKWLGVWVVNRDVTERRLAQITLKNNEEELRNLTESIPNIIWTARPDGSIDFVNQQWYKYFGPSIEKSKGWNWMSFLHPDDHDTTLKVWNESLNKGQLYQNEYRMKRFDGSYRWHLGRAIPLKDKKGNIIKWFGSLTDIEDQKEIEEKLQQQNEDLDNFFYMTSHDLKGPLANIKGLLDTLPELLSDECKKGVDDVLNMLDTSIVKFKKNLLDLIDITKAQQAGEELIEDNNLSEILDEVKSSLEELIKNSNAQITEDFTKYPSIKFSKKNLQSILYNLLSNAIKYRSSERNPEIIIKTVLLDGYILLTVQDNGLGFKPNQVNKVFSKFKRLHTEIEGSGVGLYLIKRIITYAGGKIELESEEGKGSIFKVYFKLN